jgi:glycosyltransferase involved in cell wall biosynthesis
MSTSGLRRVAGTTNLVARRRLVSAALAAYRTSAVKAEERPGLTIVVVNYNTSDKLAVVLDAVDRYTAVPYTAFVVDNASHDDSKAFLRDRPDVETVFLPVNVGHGPALDLALLRSATDTVVVLDPDAFPISDEWLQAVLGPLDDGAKVAGAYHQRAFVHPCFLAIRRQTFLRNRLSFIPVGRPSPFGVDSPGGLFLDVGESLSHILSARFGTATIHKIPPTSTRGPGTLGTVYGEVVYHNFFSTHGSDELSARAAEAWDDAVRRYVAAP